MFELQIDPGRQSVVLDTETTGLSDKNDRIVEVAAMLFNPDTGETTEHFHRYVNPQRDVPDECVKVHGLTNEFLAQQPTFDQVAEELLEFVKSRNLVIHNAPFDVRMLNAELRRCKLGSVEAAGCHVVDTLTMSRRTVRAKRHTLDLLCDRYGVDRTVRDLHGALVDCKLLAAVFPGLASAYRRVTSTLDSLLSAPMSAPLPDDLNVVAQRLFEVRGLLAVLLGTEERLVEHMRSTLEGKAAAGEGWLTECRESRRVNWTEVTAEHLVGVDLSPYTKTTESFYIKQVD